MKGAGVVLVVSALLLVGCSTDPADEADPPGESSADQALTPAEVTFLERMHHHHAQAVQLAVATARRGADDRVRGLAVEVAVTQAREQGQIEAMLAGGPSSDVEEMPGLIPADELAAALQLEGAELDARFVELMVPHHEGAVEMADEVLADDATSEAVRDLAGAIVTSQQEELTELALQRQ